MLANRSGLLGVSGVSGDLRQVLAAAETHSPRARLAYDQFIWTLRRAVGSMAGVLGGVDTLVFTGGIGENSAPRARRRFGGAGLRRAAPLGWNSGTGDRLISAADSTRVGARHPCARGPGRSSAKCCGMRVPDLPD